MSAAREREREACRAQEGDGDDGGTSEGTRFTSENTATCAVARTGANVHVDFEATLSLACKAMRIAARGSLSVIVALRRVRRSQFHFAALLASAAKRFAN
ncbi:unnamed protein product [Lampetra planeri]